MSQTDKKLRECIASLIMSPLYFSLPLIERHKLVLQTLGLMPAKD